MIEPGSGELGEEAQRSAAFSHEHEVNVKWRARRVDDGRARRKCSVLRPITVRSNMVSAVHVEPRRNSKPDLSVKFEPVVG